MNTAKNESVTKTVFKIIFIVGLGIIGSHYGAKVGLKVGEAMTGLNKKEMYDLR